MNSSNLSNIELYLGSLPKKAKTSELEKYFASYNPDIRVKLVFKRNNRDCRGHGSVSCPNQQTAQKLLAVEHCFQGRRIIIETIKTPEEIA